MSICVAQVREELLHHNYDPTAIRPHDVHATIRHDRTPTYVCGLLRYGINKSVSVTVASRLRHGALNDL